MLDELDKALVASVAAVSTLSCPDCDYIPTDIEDLQLHAFSRHAWVFVCEERK